MKVLQINCVYPSGSTGRITSVLNSNLANKGIDSYVIYGRGEKHESERVFKCSTEVASRFRNLTSRVSGNIYGSGKLAASKIIRLIKKISPDVVHLQCINGYFVDVYKLLRYLGENNIPTVLTLHAEFMYTGNCGYAYDCEKWKTGCDGCPDSKAAICCADSKKTITNWQKMKDAFSAFHSNLAVVGVSDWLSDRARESVFFKGSDITTVMNGLDTDVFNNNYDAPRPEIEKYREQGKRVILHVTPYFEDENKGGKQVLALAEKLKDENVQIIVAGPADTDAYKLENVTFLGRVADSAALASLYSHSDVCLLTSKRETFSMVCAEALCCGTPVVGYRAGGPETISLAEYSTFVEYGDIDGLAAAVKEMINRNIPCDEISRAATVKYSCERMTQEYMDVYNNLLKKMGKHNG